MTRSRIVKWLAAALALLLAYAWIDGGREPLRTISEPVAVPGGTR
jgi:hypothetical protein